MPARLAPTSAYAIVHRAIGRIVSRHPTLAEARAAWRRRAFPKPGLIKADIGSWAHTHLILPAGAASAARRRAAEAAKRNRTA